MSETENMESSGAEDLRRRHYEILMQMNFALVELPSQKNKREYITQKMKLLRRMFCDLIPSNEVRKRGNRSLTREKIDAMQSSRKKNYLIRKKEFEQLLHQFRLKSMSLAEIFNIDISSKQSIRNFIAGRAVPGERFLHEFRNLVDRA